MSVTHAAAPDGRQFDAILAAEHELLRGRWVRLAALALIVAIACQFTGLFDPARLADGVPAIAKIAGEMLPPDFTRWQAWLRPLLDTLAMSVAGTFIAITLSLPLAVLAAATTTPNAAVYRIARFMLNLLRAIPELIMGILLVAAVGFGALPGVLALGLHSIGMVGKFFAEAIEHANPKPIEAARAAGATPLQVVWRAILPQVMPQMADTTIYRWEYNFRASTVMGAVGAGGIGTQLMGSLRIMDYPQVLAILICILACVTLVDAFGSRLRRSLA
jgi:phosphonate transport system permease protein